MHAVLSGSLDKPCSVPMYTDVTHNMSYVTTIATWCVTLPCYNVAGVLAIACKATYCAREEELRNLVIDWVQEGLPQNSIEACSLQQAATTVRHTIVNCITSLSMTAYVRA